MTHALVTFLRDRYDEEQPERPHMTEGDARTAADLAAKTAIVDLHEDRAGYCNTCGGGFPCLTLRLLARPYAGHPAFRQEWSAPSDPEWHGYTA